MRRGMVTDMHEQGDNETHPLEALTWLANGTLRGEERERVERHVEHCGRCRTELRFREALGRGTRAVWSNERPGELGWARLRAAVRGERRQKAGRVPWLAAAAVLVAVQAGLLGWWVHERGEEPAYVALGEQAGPRLQVRFRPETTEVQLRRVLRDAGVALAGGPGALGVYEVRPLSVEPGALDEAARRLAASPHVIEVRRP